MIIVLTKNERNKMKTPAANLPAIRSLRAELEPLETEFSKVPNSITEEWIKKWNLTRAKIVELKAKIKNLRQGKPENGYGDKVPVFSVRR